MKKYKVYVVNYDGMDSHIEVKYLDHPADEVFDQFKNYSDAKKELLKYLQGRVTDFKFAVRMLKKRTKKSVESEWIEFAEDNWEKYTKMFG